jgi:hypothetical protein
MEEKYLGDNISMLGLVIVYALIALQTSYVVYQVGTRLAEPAPVPPEVAQAPPLAPPEPEPVEFTDPSVVVDVPGAHRLYNEIDRLRYEELSSKFITMRDLQPQDYELNEEFCMLGERNPLLQDAVYRQWCPAACSSGLAKYRTAQDKIVPFWGKGLGTQHQGLIDEMCGLAEPLISAGCAQKSQFPDLQQDGYWKALCKTPGCTKLDLAWLDAQKGLEDLHSVGADSRTTNNWVATRMCPLVEQIERECTPERIAERYAPDPYFQLCKRGADCPVVPNTWYEAQEPVRTMDRPGTNMIPTIEKYCKIGPDMDRCGYDFYSRDPLYQDWCTDMPGTKAWLTYQDAARDFEWQVSQGVNEDGQFQITERSVCPAAKDVIDFAKDPARVDHVKRNPYWQQYCANPECVKKTRQLASTTKDLDWVMSQGMNEDGKIQLLIRDVCPAMQAVMDEPQCVDKSRVTNSPYWKDYCSDAACLPLRQTAQRAEQDFYWSVEQRVTSNGLWQQASSKLCPAWSAVLGGCKDEAYKAQIRSNPYYQKYCEFPECAAAEQKAEDEQTDFYYEVGEGMNQSGQFQTLIRDVCPAFTAAHDVCPPDRAAKIEQSQMWGKYCADAPCLVPTSQLNDTIADFDWGVSQGVNEDGQFQMAINTVCPAFRAQKAGCKNWTEPQGDRAAQLYDKYCRYEDCTKREYTLYSAVKNWDWTTSQGTNADGQLQGLIRDVCPAMRDVHENCDKPGSREAVEADWRWGKWCQDSDACLQARLGWQRAKDAWAYETPRYDDDGKWQTASNRYCPAADAMIAACPRVADEVRQDPIWQQYCQYPTYARAQNDQFNANKDYDWSMSQGANQSGQYQMLIGKVCPARDRAVAAQPRTADGSAVQLNGAKAIKSYPATDPHCAIGTACLTQKANMLNKITDIDWQRSQGVTEDGVTQLVLGHLCPIFSAVKQTCTDQGTLDSITNSPYWTDYCQYDTCTQSIQNVRNKIKDWEWTKSQGTNEDGQLQGLINQVCPAFESAVRVTPCKPGAIEDLKKHYLWTDWCSQGTATLQQRLAVLRAENDLNWSMSQGMTQDGMYQTLQRTVCPAWFGLDQANPTVSAALKTKSRWWDPYCKEIQCTTTKQKLNNAYNDYNWQVSQGVNEYGKAQLVSRICPIFKEVDQTCKPEVATQIKTGAIYDQCRADAQCPIWRYDRNTKLNTVNTQGGNWIEKTANYASQVNNYCSAANLTVSQCGDMDAWVPASADYKRWCENTQCRDTILNLNSQVKDNGYSMPYYNDSGKQQIADNFVGPWLRALPQSCPAPVVADYLRAKSTANWFDYFLGRNPIASGTAKTPTFYIQNQYGQVMRWSSNADRASVQVVPLDAADPQQLWYQDTLNPIIRASGAPVTWARGVQQDRALANNGNGFVTIIDSGSRNNANWSYTTPTQGGIWTINGQQIDVLDGVVTLVPQSKTTWSKVMA